MLIDYEMVSGEKTPIEDFSKSGVHRISSEMAKGTRFQSVFGNTGEVKFFN